MLWTLYFIVQKHYRSYTFVMAIFCLLLQSFQIWMKKNKQNKTEEEKRSKDKTTILNKTSGVSLLHVVDYLSSCTKLTLYMWGQNSKKTVIHQVQYKQFNLNTDFIIATPPTSKQPRWRKNITQRKHISLWWLDPSPNQVANHHQQALLHSKLEPEPSCPYACFIR